MSKTKVSINVSSLFNWYPKTKNLPVPQPRTETVMISQGSLFRFAEEGKPLPDEDKTRIEETANKIGYPLFLRTDLASGKHSWKKSCYVPNAEDLYDHIMEVVSFNDNADILGLSYHGLVFREFLDLDWRFKAFWGQMPVARERRYFVDDGKILCHHPYWIEDAIAQWAEDRFLGKQEIVDNWREILAELNTETPEECKLLTDYAQKISEVLPRYWSLDFAHGRDGTWWFIDAALGKESWHPEDCPIFKQMEE